MAGRLTSPIEALAGGAFTGKLIAGPASPDTIAPAIGAIPCCIIDDEVELVIAIEVAGAIDVDAVPVVDVAIEGEVLDIIADCSCELTVIEVDAAAGPVADCAITVPIGGRPAGGGGCGSLDDAAIGDWDGDADQRPFPDCRRSSSLRFRNFFIVPLRR